MAAFCAVIRTFNLVAGQAKDREVLQVAPAGRNGSCTGEHDCKTARCPSGREVDDELICLATGPRSEQMHMFPPSRACSGEIPRL